MFITLSKEVTNFLADKLEPYGLTEDKRRWGNKSYDEFGINLSNLTRARSIKLKELLLDAGKLKAAAARIADIDRWLAILDGEKIRCKKLKDFAPMLKQYLKDAPRHWIYQLRKDSEVYQPYYVSNISYTPPTRNRHDGYVPGYVTVTLYWEELAQIRSTTDTYYAEEVEDLTIGAALHQAGYTVESPDILESYARNKAKYIQIHDKVGRQFTAVGIAEDTSDSDDDDYRGWWRRKRKIILSKDGVDSRVVVDVLSEGDGARGKGEHPPSTRFWEREGCDFEGDPDDDDDDIKPGDEDDDDPAENAVAQIPLAPSLMCFDLKRHTRLKIYVDQLTEYKYQADLAAKLILPEEITSLVDMLVAHKGGFKDIIGNKGGGAVILCAGPPGTGKTLTSEIYSEAMARPLYSVQCSQLGTDPDELEKQLLIVFARAQRWNAILLLDEADVYVAARGHDLQQNAIVGVFLRVLEYYGGVLFLTTNRADLVDDAIASRCLARITYKIPTQHDQKRIWRTLADTAGITMADSEISRIANIFPELSGRDVKNLLKLGSMVAAAKGTGIVDSKTIEFVKQFKPTTEYKG